MSLVNVGYAEAAAPEYAVPASVSSADNAVSDLERSVTRLRDRLGPVITMRPDTNKKAELRSSSCVPLADQIDAVTVRVREANESLVDLLDRLHV